MARPLHQKLKGLRRAKKLTLRDLERKAGIDKSQLSRYEKGGAKPTYQSLLALARALEVRTGYLTGEIRELEILSPRDVAVWESFRLFAELRRFRDIGAAQYQEAIRLALRPPTLRAWEEVDEASRFLTNRQV
jgi:transcriptional regulator with XRE-family HTH domain